MDRTRSIVLVTLVLVALSVIGSLVVLATVTFTGLPALVTTALLVAVVLAFAVRGSRPNRRLETSYW